VRSSHGYLGGVCEGLGQRFSIEPNLLRLGWLVSTFVFGTGALLYLALWWLLPRSDDATFEPTVWIDDPSGQKHPPLARTDVDRKFLGVCGGLARRWELDPTIVRLSALSLFVLTGPLALMAYLTAAIFIPSSDRLLEKSSQYANPIEL
jgi:phage shock protein PspC (stress-responsive transcriptional regulator)